MKLSSISGEVIQAFQMFELENSREIKYTKASNPRDVVTSLDLKIHEILQKFCAEKLQGTTFISEESPDLQSVMECIANLESALVVDPLDGSNNVVCQIREFGFMACLVKKGVIVESLIVLPNEGQILSWTDSEGFVSSRTLQVIESPSATTYLAYSPNLDTKHSSFRSLMMNFLDETGAGVYRYGSACVGLFRTLVGAHSMFIGLKMRPWDVISYFPLLSSQGLKIIYTADSSAISFLATKSEVFLTEGQKLLEDNLHTVQEYCIGKSLKVST